MIESTPSDSDTSIFDFYELDERPVVINRLSNEGWVWNHGSWQGYDSSTQLSDIKSLNLSQDDFVRRFPYAALALLEVQGTP